MENLLLLLIVKEPDTGPARSKEVRDENRKERQGILADTYGSHS